MYYYQIQDVNGQIVDDSSVGYDTGDDAANAAKDQLASMYPPNYPVEIRISGRPPDESNRYFSSIYYMDAEMVRQHALSKTDRKNRPELQNILKEAISDYDIYKDQWEKGYLTPRDFAREMAIKWGEVEGRIREIE